MKILFASQVPDSRLLGVPRVLYCVGDVLKQRGHSIDYFFEDDAPKAVFKKAALIEWGLRAAPIIGERCKQKQYDAVVITTASGWCLSTFRKQLLPAKTKIVSSHHGWEELMWDQMLLEELQPNGVKFSPQFKLYYGGVILWALRQSLQTQDGFIFTSSEETAYVQQQNPKIADKCRFIRNGVSDFYFYPQRFEKPDAAKAVRLLFVGYWDPWRKGRQYLVEAFNQLVSDNAPVELTLAGTKLGADVILPEFSEAARHKITVVPQTDEAGLNALYQSHDVFVLPSLFEGMPLVMLEAMASGMPCVTTDNNGMHDVIETGKNGILIPRRNTQALVTALSMLVADASLRKQMGQNAQALMREAYTWEAVAIEWEKMLLDTIAG